MKIYIPEPCHENWSAMTPNEQGRFCGSCQKTVVDFTNFSTEDIQNYFTKHYGQKVCGRFKNEQIQQINIQIPTHLFSYISASRKFALALLIVFGTTLFSCKDHSGNNATIGKIEVVDSLKTKDTTEKLVVGEMAIKPKPVVIEERELQGEVAYPESRETMGISIEYPTMGDTMVVVPIKEELTVGKVKRTQIDTLPKVEKIIMHTKGLIDMDYRIDSILRNK